MKYFDLYQLPVSFFVDEEAVKRKFLELSRKYHPDFFVNEAEEKQQEMLELSTLNTKAFQTLSDFDKRMKYILVEKGLIHEGERYELPPHFLMDMMAINEGLMELKMDPEESRVGAYKVQVDELLQDLYGEIRNLTGEGVVEKMGEEDWKSIKDYYYKKKYLLRIQHSLNTFTGQP